MPFSYDEQSIAGRCCVTRRTRHPPDSSPYSKKARALVGTYVNELGQQFLVEVQGGDDARSFFDSPICLEMVPSESVPTDEHDSESQPVDSIADDVDTEFGEFLESTSLESAGVENRLISIEPDIPCGAR